MNPSYYYPPSPVGPTLRPLSAGIISRLKKTVPAEKTSRIRRIISQMNMPLVVPAIICLDQLNSADLPDAWSKTRSSSIKIYAILVRIRLKKSSKSSSIGKKIVILHELVITSGGTTHVFK
jgi:hypothetical protein